MRGNIFYISILAFLCGIALRTFYSLSGGLLISCIGSGIFLLCWSFVGKSHRLLGCGVLFIAFALGIVRLSFMQTEIPSSFLDLIGSMSSLPGIVAADTDSRETSNRITLQVVHDGERTKILAVVSPWVQFPIGEHVVVSGKLKIPQPFDSEGGHTFAYDKFLAMNGIFALEQHAQVRSTGPPQGILFRLWGILLSIKALTVQLLQRAIPEPYVSLAVGILIGGKQGLGPTPLADFTAAGMLQIVVLSGYNVMIVAEGVVKIFSRLPKTIALGLASLTIMLFVITAGASSSALRAGYMACVALLARATGRKYNVLRALLFSLFILVFLNPMLLIYDPGLQLSFLATLGLIVGSPIVERYLLWITISAVRELFATSIAAQVAVLPLLLYESGNLSIVALPANILAMPAVPVAMVLSAFSAIATFLVPTLGPLAGAPAGIFLWYIIQIAKVSANLPFSHVIVSAFSFWIVALIYALLVVLVWFSSRATRFPREIASQPLPN